MIAIVAIMAILKKKVNPRNRNCCNYGNSVNDIIDLLMRTIVAILAILKKKVKLNPNGRNCCNYGNSKKTH